MIVLDTHVWLWWLSNPEKLSPAAAERIEKETQASGIRISSISVWEIAMLVAKGRLELAVDITEWFAVTESLSFVKFIPVNNSVAVQAVRLPGHFHDDPADRIIVATAMVSSASIISADNKIRGYRGVKSVW
jgi:PIN domain nuclease of toxin-antitoxin system